MVAVYEYFEIICHSLSLFPYKMFFLLVYKICKMYIISNPNFIGDDLFAMFQITVSLVFLVVLVDRSMLQCLQRSQHRRFVMSRDH